MTEPSEPRKRPTGGRSPSVWPPPLRAALRLESAHWLETALLQLLLTWGFLVLSRMTVGGPWESEARILVLLGALATWGLALRAIRARILELLRFWQSSRAATRAATHGPATPELERPPGRGPSWQTVYVSQTLRRLRIIAAGVSLPFFVLPLWAALLCVVVCAREGARANEWGTSALFYWFIAFTVVVYFRWSVVPPTRLAATPRLCLPRGALSLARAPRS